MQGLVYAALGPILYLPDRIPPNYQKTIGTVTSEKFVLVIQKTQNSTTKLPTYYPEIQYKVNGINYSMQGYGVVNGPSSIIIGQKKSVSYNPNNPALKPRITGDNGPLIAAFVLPIFGLSLAGFCFYLLKRKTVPDYRTSKQAFKEDSNPKNVPIMALIAGYAGAFAIVIIPAPIVLVLGLIGLIESKKTVPNRGNKRSWFAIILGLIGSLTLAYGIYAVNFKH